MESSKFGSNCKMSLNRNVNGTPSLDSFPKDLSAKYALTCALAVRAKTVKEVENAFLYIDKKGGMEWLNQCTYDVCTIWKSKSDIEKLVDMLVNNDKLMDVAARMQKLLAA